MRIGIVTFHRAYNCGAMLQSWALKKVLERMGHVVTFPSCNEVGVPRSRWRIPLLNHEKKGVAAIRSLIGRVLVNLMSIPSEDILRLRYRRFKRRFIPECDCSPRQFAKNYDLMVYGSDQIWNPSVSKTNAALFFNEENSGVCSIAYAASIGDSPLNGEDETRLRRAIGKFSQISVREPVARAQIKSISGVDAAITIDPTLLVTLDDYRELLGERIIKKDYLLLYTLEASGFYLNAARELAARLGVRCIVIDCYQYSRFGTPKDFLYSVSPDLLVQYAFHAKYILAASFHGTVMGVIFKKPFLSLRGRVDQYESRPAALLRKIGCSSRLVNPTTSLDEMESLLREPLPDYSAVIEKDRAASLEWLRRAIEK